MGLDQYLYANQYLSPSEFMGAERNQKYSDIISAVKAESFVHDDLPSASVAIKVGYWRKENAIHEWFVANCQNGEDDCREYPVMREQLETLKSVCETVLLDKQVTGTDDLAKEMLGTSEGFFFGSTEYDEWYYGGLTDTIAIIDGCLKMSNDWEFSYQSSW